MKINKMIGKAMVTAVAATMLIGGTTVMADERTDFLHRLRSSAEEEMQRPRTRNNDWAPWSAPLVLRPDTDPNPTMPRIIMHEETEDDDDVHFTVWCDMDFAPVTPFNINVPEDSEQRTFTIGFLDAEDDSSPEEAVPVAPASSAAPSAPATSAAPATPAAAPVTQVLGAVRLGPEDFVNHLYATALGRTADSTGYAFWTGILNSGEMTQAQAACAFLTSAEFEARGLNNVDFVTTLYSVFFNREPDHNGLNHWVSSIKNGEMTRTQVIEAFIGSPEWNS